MNRSLTTPELQKLYGAVAYERRLLMLVGALSFFVISDVFQVALAGSTGAGPIKAMFYPLLLLVVLFHLPYLLRGLMAAPEVTGLLLLSLLSVAWSVNPLDSFEEVSKMLVPTALVMVVASMVSLRGFVLAAASMGGILMAACLVAIVLLPSARGIDPWPDTWRGVFNHKNTLGTFSTYALLLAITGSVITRGMVRRIMILFAAMAALLLVASESRTAQLIATLSLLALSLGLALPRFSRVWAAGYLLAIGILAALAYLAFATGFSETIFQMIGRRPTLSGRLPLWELVWPWVEARIWTGYGYAAFWDPEARAVIEITRDRSVGFEPFYSHNGLLETLLNVGVLGVVFLMLAYVRALAGIFWVCNVPSARPVAVLSLVLLLAFLMFNITESSILGRENPSWLVVVGLLTKFGLVLASRPPHGDAPPQGRGRAARARGARGTAGTGLP